MDAALRPIPTIKTKIVKTSASTFPDFDEEMNYDIWNIIWKGLTNNSDLSEQGFFNQDKRSLMSRAKD